MHNLFVIWYPLTLQSFVAALTLLTESQLQRIEWYMKQRRKQESVVQGTAVADVAVFFRISLDL